MRDAESLLDQLSLLRGEITVEKVWDLVGSVPERDLMRLLEAIAQDNPEALLDSTRRLMDRGREPLIVLQNLASFYRDLLIAKTAPARGDLVAMTSSTWSQLCEFAKQLDMAAILAGQQHLRSSEGQIKSTTQPRLWLEVTLMGLLPSAILQSRPINRGIVSKPAIANGRQPVNRESPPSSQNRSAVSSPSSAPVVATRTETSDAIPPADPQPQHFPATEIPAIAQQDSFSSLPPEILNNETDDGDSGAANSPSSHPTFGLNDIWQEMLKQVQPFSTQTLLRQQGCLLSLTEQEAHVGISAQWHKTAKTKISNLEAAFEKSLSRKVSVNLEIATPADLKAARELSTSSNPSPHPPQPVRPWC